VIEVSENTARSAGHFFMEMKHKFCGEAATTWRQAAAPPAKAAARQPAHRVLRGASWDNNNATNTLSSNRNNNTPDNRNNNNGFRCVLVVGGGGKAVIRSTNRRDAQRGEKPCCARVKNEPNPCPCPLEKTDTWTEPGQSGPVLGLAIPAVETHPPRQGQDAVPARGLARQERFAGSRAHLGFTGL